MRRFRKTIKKLICLLTALLIVFNCSEAKKVSAAPNYSGITSDSIKNKEKQIKESESLKKQLKNQVSDAKKLKQELEGYKADVSAYISQIDTQLTAIQDYIDTLEAMIIEKENQIEETTRELEEAIETENSQYEAMKKRIQFMYEQGDTFYLELIFSAKSFGDFLTKADYIDQLEAYDKQKLTEYREMREWTELCKATLESEKEALDEVKLAQEAEEAALEELLAEKEKELASYNKQITEKAQEIADAEAAYAAEVAVIEQLEAQILEEKKAIAATMTSIIYDGGMFAWPCPKYIRITEEYGWRNNPINGKREFHSGLDMGAPGGSPILAAYDGKVVAATYNWSMGNYVMIDHGSGLYTIYMHASKLYVSQGQVVVKGEQIAAVGTTGSSTGNHLHFSVRLNGEYQNPWNYLK